MLVGNSVFSLELFADSDENVNKGRIETAQGGILNYEMKDDYLKFNVALTIKGVLVMKQIEFVRDEDGNVAGYFYEYVGLKEAALKTSAVIAFNEDYAIVTSAKRESDDLLVKGYEEVYSSSTGRFISAEVLENIGKDYDTFWVNVFDVSGITNVKAISNDSLLPSSNHHDVYINNSSSTFTPVKGALGLGSRHFDIEMKTVYYVVEIDNGKDVEYQIVETKIPMLFVQKDNVEDFSEEAVDKNKNTFEGTPSLPIAKIEVAEDNFLAMYDLLVAIKESCTYDELVNQLGTKDSFFN
jgi:hypothetical protein